MFNFSSIFEMAQEELPLEDLFPDYEDDISRNEVQEKLRKTPVQQSKSIPTDTNNKARSGSFGKSLRNLLFPPNLRADAEVTSEAISRLPRMSSRDEWLDNEDRTHETAEDDDNEVQEILKLENRLGKMESSFQKALSFQVSIGTPPILAAEVDYNANVSSLESKRKTNDFQHQLAQVRESAKQKYEAEKKRQVNEERCRWHYTGGHSVVY
mmetsp:Transcript_2762/g.3123  ORF Transcript_2762/g.3123 Transcript_2762/m.3123 type:complete len:211 (+) Transcript_2762:61-693(+)